MVWMVITPSAAELGYHRMLRPRALYSHIAHVFPLSRLFLTWHVCLGSILRVCVIVRVPMLVFKCVSQPRGLASSGGRWQSCPVSGGFRVTGVILLWRKKHTTSQTSRITGAKLLFGESCFLTVSCSVTITPTEWLIKLLIDGWPAFYCDHLIYGFICFSLVVVLFS